MARDYGSRRSSRSRRGSPHQLLVITVTFLLGYFTASVFDAESISRWVNTQVLAHHEMKKLPSQPEAQQTVLPPKPKFEFYTLLANEKVAGSQSSPHPASTQSVSASQATIPATPAKVVAVLSATAGKPNVPQTAAIKAAETKAVETQSSSKKGSYLVQVASFKDRQDAEHMKGSLTLKGFNVYIVPVTHANKGNWFRVVVGPYPNRILAQQAQFTLAKNERLNGMVTSGG